jgi:hypothetical protein
MLLDEAQVHRSLPTVGSERLDGRALCRARGAQFGRGPTLRRVVVSSENRDLDWRVADSVDRMPFREVEVRDDLTSLCERLLLRPVNRFLSEVR